MKKSCVKILTLTLCVVALCALLLFPAAAEETESTSALGRDDVDPWEYPFWKMEIGSLSTFEHSYGSGDILSGDGFSVEFSYREIGTENCDCGKCCDTGMWEPVSYDPTVYTINFRKEEANKVPFTFEALEGGGYLLKFGQYKSKGGYASTYKGGCDHITSHLNKKTATWVTVLEQTDYFEWEVLFPTGGGTPTFRRYQVYFCSDCAEFYRYVVYGQITAVNDDVWLAICNSAVGQSYFTDMSMKDAHGVSVTSPLLERIYDDGWSNGEDTGYKSGYDMGYLEGVDATIMEYGDDNCKYTSYLSWLALKGVPVEESKITPEEVERIDWIQLVRMYRNDGYNQALENANEDERAFTGMVFSIFDAPVRLVGSMLDFEIFGINMFSFVKVILTACMFGVVLMLFLKVFLKS